MGQARAKLAREELGVYGIRVVEPHHDGTPHWHLLLFMQPGAEPRVTGILREYAEAESPEELFDRWGYKTTARFDVEKIDYSRGTAAGYVAKYISKNINGEQFARDSVEGDNLDHYGHDLSESAPRIEAWAATWAFASSSSSACPASPSGARSAASPSSRRTSCAGGKKPPGPRRKRHHASPRSARPPMPASGISSCASWAAPTRRAANSPSSPGA